MGRRRGPWLISSCWERVSRGAYVVRRWGLIPAREEKGFVLGIAAFAYQVDSLVEGYEVALELSNWA